jgi:hypothetical protein
VIARGPSGEPAAGTPSPYTSNENVTVPGGTPSARRFALHVHAPPELGFVAAHMTFSSAPAQVAENATLVNVVTPGPEAVGLADRDVVYDVSVTPAFGLTQVPPRTRAADVGAACRSAAGVGVAGERDGGASVASGEAVTGVVAAGDGDGEVEAAPHAATMTVTTRQGSVPVPRHFILASSERGRGSAARVPSERASVGRTDGTMCCELAGATCVD